MTSLSHPLPHFPVKGFLPYDLSAYSMPHLSHTSLIGPLVNPFAPSNILSMFQDDSATGEKSIVGLRPFQVRGDRLESIVALSAPPIAATATETLPRSKSEQSPSTQVTSSTSDNDVPTPTQRNVIVRNESVRKKKELVKDEAYWERRRKNNDAAKRSRDSRRQKEDEMALRAAVLEQENIRLRLELEHLRSEVERLRILILSPASATVLHAPSAVSLATTNITATSPCPLPSLDYTTPGQLHLEPLSASAPPAGPEKLQ